jgi:uncharacterized protein
MKINLEGIPPQGVILEEDISPEELDLGLETFALSGPLATRARVSRITNAVHVELELSGEAVISCSRCLNDSRQRIHRELTFDYAVEARQHELDLTQDIRDELIMGLPFKSLCKEDCKGLCVRCGADLNKGKCACKQEDKN